MAKNVTSKTVIESMSILVSEWISWRKGEVFDTSQSTHVPAADMVKLAKKFSGYKGHELQKISMMMNYYLEDPQSPEGYSWLSAAKSAVEGL